MLDTANAEEEIAIPVPAKTLESEAVGSCVAHYVFEGEWRAGGVAVSRQCLDSAISVDLGPMSFRPHLRPEMSVIAKRSTWKEVCHL